MMKDVSLESVKNRAKQFRAALEVCDKCLLPISFEEFPRGSCDDAALLLGKFLQDSGLGRFDYVCGEIHEGDNHNFQTHAWLQQGELIVDITADQFDEIREPVLVTRDHSWHNRFNAEVRNVADYEIYDSRTKAILSAAHERVLSYMGGI
jgi:hypothetical protein